MRIALALLIAVSNAWSGPIPASRPIIMPRITAPAPAPRVTAPAMQTKTQQTPVVRTTSFNHNNRTNTATYQNGVLMWVIWFSMINGQQVEHKADCQVPKTDAERKLCEAAAAQR